MTASGNSGIFGIPLFFGCWIEVFLGWGERMDVENVAWACVCVETEEGACIYTQLDTETDTHTHTHRKTQ